MGIVKDDSSTNSISITNTISITNYLQLYWYFRDKMIISWSEEEILAGFKVLRGNKRMYLDDALIDKSLVKLDVWAEIPYPDMKNKKRYLEITNWFLVEVTNADGEVEVLSMVQEDRIKSLRGDIYMYLSSYYFDPLKATKRYWNYLLEWSEELKRQWNKSIDRELKLLAPLFSSYVSFLNSISTDIQLQKKLLGNKLITKEYYNQFMNDTRERMTNYFPICYYNETINNKLINSLDTEKMGQVIDDLTLKYLEDHKINILQFIEKN